MTAPEGHERPGFVCRLKRALYGLKESPRLWNKELHGWLSSQGFSQSKSDLCLYVNRDRTVYLCIYVDDILCVSHTDDASRAFVSEMRKRFVVTDCGMPKVFLGIQLAYDRARRVLRMCQTDLIDTLLKRYNLGGPNRNFSLSKQNLSAGLVRHIKSGQAYPQNDGNRCGCNFLGVWHPRRLGACAHGTPKPPLEAC